MKNHDYYYNIFSSSVASKITAKEALYDLVGLHIAVGDGLPTTVCPLCLKKQTEFSVFKKICLVSNAALRKSLPRSCCKSFEGGGASDDNLEPSVEAKDCIQDVIENNSQPTYSAQTTEICIPVPDCLLPRDDKLTLEGGAEADGSEGDLPKKQQSEEYDEGESFCLMLESDSDEGDECRNSDARTKVVVQSDGFPRCVCSVCLDKLR
ncbi:uncharacterized protein LOC124173147 [Ischnura elegans]|uniref:uncharacterized protein LOC124173147 n=1 Tax=Ischnura elegans TaxID=197161 RepID=UPI001ED875A5|nr:uncharacterized protein LOC124173147 [Ischnura elegans]XP_046408619.1 uncharacterized protein LOC124173147 [Ischnura elegans]